MHDVMCIVLISAILHSILIIRCIVVIIYTHITHCILVAGLM